MLERLNEWLGEVEKVDGTEIKTNYFDYEEGDDYFSRKYAATLERMTKYFNSINFSYDAVVELLEDFKEKADAALNTGGCNGESWECNLSPEQKFIVKLFHLNKYTNSGIKKVLDRYSESLSKECNS
jgi:hypothetical protein